VAEPKKKGRWFAFALSVVFAVTASVAWSQSAEPPTGDQHRQYVFAPTGETLPYRFYVPTTWDGTSALPILLFLHGAGADENSYLDMNDGLLLRLAEQHGYIVVSPLGYRPLGAYGNPLRLPAVFGESEAAAQQRAAVTAERQRELAFSELDVITVLEIVTETYGADRSRTFLAGHSMGSGGAWHLAARYPERWRAVAPMSGPFIDAETYPFELIRDLPILMTEGTGAAPSLAGSRALNVFMSSGDFDFRYLEVDGNHGSMVPMVWPAIFEFFDAVSAQTPAEVRLWPEGAPGSAHWRIPEQVSAGPGGDRVVSNVSDPTLSVFLPDPELATGTAVVIAPGGALRALSMDNEGVRVAEWLNTRGIAAFVLKYRTLQQDPDAPRRPVAGMPGPGGPREELVIRNANANPAPDDEALSEVLEFAIADAQQALRWVRITADDWGIDPARVGVMGFSAGGGVAVGAALAEKSDASPDFLISLYGPSLMDVFPPEHAPPLFIAVGSTHFNVTNGCLALFDAWRAAGKPAEIHVYDGVSAGFGMTPRGLPVDGWTERLHEWMVARELTTAVATGAAQ
jgi:acetyl esterase/lipase